MSLVVGRSWGLVLATAVVLCHAGCGDNTKRNRPPTATDGAVTTAEDTPVALRVVASDPDGDILSYSVTTKPAHGTVSGDFPSAAKYTPAADYHGADQLVVTVSDGVLSVTSTISVTVTAANDGPTAVDDALAAREDTALTVAASTLLANDTDPDGDAITLTAVAGATHGTVALAGTAITFTPDHDFAGNATFTYTASDGSATDDATVTIAVGGDNDVPVAVADAITTDEDTVARVPAATLLANDTDAEGQVLAITEVGGAVGGTVAIDGADVVFTPTLDFFGAASFTYTITDGADVATATVAVTVNPVNDAPVASADVATTAEDVAVVIAAGDLLANDSDVDSATLTVTAVGDAVNGTVALAGTDITFTPTPDFNGDATFTYTVSDGELSATATVTVTVTGTNDAPIAVGDAVLTDEDVPATITAATLVANDTDVEGATLTVTAVGGAVNGTVAMVDADITFTPTHDFNGMASFTYTVSDGELSATGTVIVMVMPVNDAPVANDDPAITTAEDTPVVITAAMLLANDTDVEGATLTVTSVSDAVNGTVELVGTDITFRPAADFNGTATFVYTASDGDLSDTATVTVTVTSVNDTPVAVDDAFATDEDARLTLAAVDLLRNDTDPEGTTLTVTAVGAATNGTVALAGTTITFVPAPDFNGTATFTYTASDGDLSDDATVTVTVAPVNDAPVANDDTAATDEDTAVVIAAGALLGNDTDVDGDPLTVTAVGGASHGTVVLAGTDITFTPDHDFNGAAAFTYTVSDGALTAIGTVAVTVNAVNDQPVAVDDTRTTAEDTALPITGASLAANDTDPEGGALTVTAVGNATNGAVAIVGDAITFTPAPEFHGTATFTYTVSDGTLSDEGLVTIDVTSVNDAPVANDDTATTDEDARVAIATGDLLGNDTDIDGDLLTVTAVGGAIHGTVALAGGIVTFTPEPDFAGAASFTYTVFDGSLSDTGVVAVTVNPINDAPVAVDDSRTTPEDTALTVTGASLAANDTDVESDALTVTAVGAATHGTVVQVGDAITFTPDADFSGTATFDYTVSDGALTAVGTVTVTVTPVNDAPVAVDDSRTTAEDTLLVMTGASLVANDTDPEGSALTVTAVAGAVNGTVALAAGNVTFTPALNFNGAASFTYTVSDGALTAVGTVAVTVTPVNDAPVANADAVATGEDTPAVIAAATLTANDTDVDSATLTVTAVSAPSHGTAVLAGGNVTFTPAPDFDGVASFTYTVSDGALTDTAVVTVTVTAVNDAPVAVNDVRTTAEDTALVVAGSALAANDTDVDGDALTVTAVGGAINGTVALVAGSVTFTPAANFSGAASFTYTVSDGALTDVGTVAVTVTAVNDRPVAVDDARTTAEDTALVVTGASLVANDTDVEGSALTVTAVGGATNGTVALAAGSVTFTPAANFSGTASFTYTVSDGGLTDVGLVTVTVTPVNDAPVASNDTAITAEDTALVIAATALTANDTDVDSAVLNVTAVGGAVNGTVALAGGNVTFTPSADFSGAGSFTYTVSDGSLTDTATVAVTVTPVGDAPVAVNDARTTVEDTALVVAGSALTANDTDVDSAVLTVTAVGGAVNGTVALAGGNVTFTPALNFNGAASFTYTVSDGALTDVGTVAVTVTAVNDAPIAVNDATTTAEDTAVIIAAATLTANDTDVDSAVLTVTAVGGASHGTVALAAGNVTFTPDANFHGSASFTYTVSDGALTDVGTVTVVVSSVNDAPVAVNDARTTAEDTPLVVTGASLAANDTDADGDALTVTAVGGAVNGTVALVAGSVTFTPSLNFNGAASFTYTVSDGALTDVGTVAVTVTAVNDRPIAIDDARTTAEDTALVVAGSALTANDTDVDSAVLTVTAVGNASHGTVALAGGNVTFTPDANFNGSASFEYTVSDGSLTDVGLVTVVVTPVADAPVAVDDARTTAEDTALVVTGASLTANDTDVDGDALTVTAVNNPTHGTVVLAAGTVTFTPTANYNGPATFTYTVSDGALTAVGTVNVTVTAVNDPPVAVNDALNSTEDNTLIVAGGVLTGNDTDVDGNALTVTAVSNPTHGTVTLASGNVTFTPVANYNGPATFTYTVSDGTATATATVTITIAAVNDAPVAVADARVTDNSTPLLVTAASLLANDTDVEGSPLTMTGVSAASAQGGTVVLAAGTVTYTPPAGFIGNDTFTYTITDGAATATGTVTVGVTGLIASFESGDYTGWSIVGTSGFPIMAVGNGTTTFVSGGNYFDYFSNTIRIWNGTPPFGPVTATDGTRYAAWLETSNTIHRMTRTVTIPTGATSLTWDMQYLNSHTTFDPGNQYIQIQLLNATTDAVLATLYKTTAGVDPLTRPMTTFSASVTAFAGTTVKLRVEKSTQLNFFGAAFDNFELQ